LTINYKTYIVYSSVMCNMVLKFFQIIIPNGFTTNVKNQRKCAPIRSVEMSHHKSQEKSHDTAWHNYRGKGRKSSAGKSWKWLSGSLRR
jgi:hypothetical protein